MPELYAGEAMNPDNPLESPLPSERLLARLDIYNQAKRAIRAADSVAQPPADSSKPAPETGQPKPQDHK